MTAASSTMSFRKGIDFFVIHESNPVSDRDLFFGPLDGTEEFIIITDETMIEDILVQIGIFPSKNQARKNLEATHRPVGKIPVGFHEMSFGKNHKRKTITILGRIV